MSQIRMPENRVLRSLAYLILALAGVLGLWRVETTSNEAKEAARDAERATVSIEKESLDRARAICEAGNINRDIILQLVESIAMTPSGVNFAQVSGFDQLDPDLQQYLENLSTPSDTSGVERIVQTARDLLTQNEC